MSSLLTGRKPLFPRCGACGVHLQRLDPGTSYARMAGELCLQQGATAPTPIHLALVAHTAVVHDDLTELPELLT